jgi:uncharacterized membrane protein
VEGVLRKIEMSITPRPFPRAAEDLIPKKQPTLTQPNSPAIASALRIIGALAIVGGIFEIFADQPTNVTVGIIAGTLFIAMAFAIDKLTAIAHYLRSIDERAEGQESRWRA